MQHFLQLISPFRAFSDGAGDHNRQRAVALLLQHKQHSRDGFRRPHAAEAVRRRNPAAIEQAVQQFDVFAHEACVLTQLHQLVANLSLKLLDPFDQLVLDHPPLQLRQLAGRQGQIGSPVEMCLDKLEIVLMLLKIKLLLLLHAV
ncbi:hypothetical protein D3C73_1123500 [compost metagenome]